MSASSEYLNTLTRLTEASGQQQAEAVRARAEATSAAQRANAAIWGQTIGNIGQYISQIPAQQLEMQKAKQQMAMQQAQLQTIQRAQQGQDNINGILSSMMTSGPGGIQTLDRDKLRQAFAAKNVPLNLQSETLKSLDDVDASLAKFQQTKIDHTADIANSILTTHKADEPISPETVHLGLAIAKANGLADDASIAKINDLLAQGADPRQVLETARAQSEKYKAKPEEFAFGAGLGTYSKNTGALKTPVPEKPEYREVGGNLIELPGRGAAAATNPQIGTIEPPPMAPGSTPAQPAAAPVLPSGPIAGGGAHVVFTAPPPAITPYQQAELARQRAADANMAHHRGITETLGQQREAREAAQQAASNAPPIEIKPGSQDYEVAKDLASGKLTTNDFFRLYGRAASGANKRSGIYLAARQLNPDFDPANFELGFKMAGNPQMVQRVVAINALGPVIDRIEGLVDESGNTGLPGFNKLLNSAKFQLGGKTVTDFRQLQTILGDEVGNALGVGTGSDLKTKLGLDLVNPNLSPSNFRSTMEQLKTTLESRKQLLQQPMGPYGGRLNPGTTTTGGPKVGDVKTFPNGKQGRWDGQGWELVTSGAR